MKKILLALITAIMAMTMTSCSVVMAAKGNGTTPSKVTHARSRGEFLTLGGQILQSEQQADGKLVEVYRFKKTSKSAVRAFMHGFMDVITTGLWEVVGTPMECCLDSEEYFAIRVTYDQNMSVHAIQFLAS